MGHHCPPAKPSVLLSLLPCCGRAARKPAHLALCFVSFTVACSPPPVQQIALADKHGLRTLRVSGHPPVVGRHRSRPGKPDPTLAT